MQSLLEGTTTSEKKTIKQVNTMPNMLELNKLYSINISPNDGEQHFRDPDSMKKIHTKYRKWMKQMDMHNIYVELYPEYSIPRDATAHPRYHFHGVIKLTSVRAMWKFLSYFWSILLINARVEIDTIDDEKLWREYITKNKKLMKAIHKVGSLEYPTFQSKDYTMVELS